MNQKKGSDSYLVLLENQRFFNQHSHKIGQYSGHLPVGSKIGSTQHFDFAEGPQKAKRPPKLPTSINR